MYHYSCFQSAMCVVKHKPLNQVTQENVLEFVKEEWTEFHNEQLMPSVEMCIMDG